jgi:hypothetical protein
MRRLLAALAVIAAGCATTSAPVETLSLTPGETVTVRIEESGLSIVERGTAPPVSEIMASTARNLGAGVYGPAMGPDSVRMPIAGSDEEIRAIPDDVVRITFVQLPGEGQDMLLLLENGYDEAMAYQAVITQRERSVRTDVCTVIPHRRGVEHWPNRIDRIDLAQVRLTPWREGDRPICR